MCLTGGEIVCLIAPSICIDLWVGVSLMDIQDVAFLSSRVCFSTTVLIYCGRVGSIETISCHKTVVAGKQGHEPRKILSLQQLIFLCQLNFMETIRLL